ncbi:major facilitator superfamily domain-containing protein 6-like [Asbolus verrucosus]|uniref:Major facilitator superfamily domain-containing protein 6-like n=1 Tax=Asbolus verrucosus TaxID=1661398 RepID=A0A482VE30_ASBVE|nr:major facilitator superfamily domain-containing protein 6-like [Asbolus verrucosus]
MNNYFKLFYRRISKDFQQKQLLTLKLLFFMHSSTVLVLYPYLTIHMRELGINVEETATMSAVVPVMVVLMPPLAGLIADKIGNFRVMLALFSSIGGASALLLMLVPVGRITITYPDRLVFGMSCSSEDPLALSLYQQHACTPVQVQNQTELRIESCGFACQAQNQSNVILNATSYELQVYNSEGNTTDIFKYTLTDEDMHAPDAISKTLNHKTLINNERFLTSIRKLSKNVYYFPAPSLFNISCDITNSSSFKCRKFKTILQPVEVSEDDVLEERQYYNLNIERNTSCLDDFDQQISIVVTIPESQNSSKILVEPELGNCVARCLVTANRKNVCSNDDYVIELDMQLTFWSYLVIRVFLGVISGTSFAMFEGAVIAILREHKADYGLQRIYATIGGMISSPLSGLLIDFASRGKGYTDFTPIFFLYAILKIISGILMLFINLEFKKPAASVIKDVLTVLKKMELIALFIACLILGSAWGYIESFLFWLLQDLGSSNTLMGLTITVGGLVGIPLLVLSGPIIKKIGHANVIFIGFAFYAIRLIGYSVIYNPWLCLIFEAMESVTFGLSFTAAVTYAAKLSTVTTDTTIQGLLGCLYFAVGKGIGSLIGGHLIHSYGIRSTFQNFAIFTAVTGLVYLAFHHLYMKKRPSAGTDITKKDVEKPPQGFVDVDLKTKTESHHEVPAVYEEALTNPAYEDTEFNEETGSGREATNNAS